MKTHSDVLIFVEDTGASHCVAELPVALAERGIHSAVLAAGLAKANLLSRNILFEEIEDVVRPSIARIFDDYQPKMLLVGTSDNPDTLGLQLVSQARSAGVESVGIVDAHGNAHLRFRGNGQSVFGYAPDWLLVSTELTRDAYAALGYPSERLIVSGHPHYDFVRNMCRQLASQDREKMRRRLFPGLRPDQKVVVFASEGPVRLRPRSQQYLSECTFPSARWAAGRTELVLHEFLEAMQQVKCRPYLALRLHPRDTPDDYRAYQEAFDIFNRGGLSLEVIHAADYVVGMTSMFMMEAALLEKPTLSIVPHADETNILPAIRMGLTKCVMTRKQLLATLEDFLNGDCEPKAAVESRIAFGAVRRICDFISIRLNKQVEM